MGSASGGAATSAPVEPSKQLQPAGSWWEWLTWRGRKDFPQTAATSKTAEDSAAEQTPSTSKVVLAQIEQTPKTGWERIAELYERPSMEVDATQRVVRMSFFGGFLLGGAMGYSQAGRSYEINNVGRKFLSPNDAVKRRLDYAIVRFAKGGFGMGFKCALISGSIVLLTTHVTAYRDRFASWYFPAISALVGGVFAFPLGVIGIVKSAGLGVSSGLTLSAVVHLYALSVDKSVNDAYRMFKRDYEKELQQAAAWDERLRKVMAEEKIIWRHTAAKTLKERDAKKLADNDD